MCKSCTTLDLKKCNNNCQFCKKHFYWVFAKIGIDTAANEPTKACYKLTMASVVTMTTPGFLIYSPGWAWALIVPDAVFLPFPWMSHCAFRFVAPQARCRCSKISQISIYHSVEVFVLSDISKLSNSAWEPQSINILVVSTTIFFDEDLFFSSFRAPPHPLENLAAKKKTLQNPIICTRPSH